jgi:hypothetical protein
MTTSASVRNHQILRSERIERLRDFKRAVGDEDGSRESAGGDTSDVAAIRCSRQVVNSFLRKQRLDPSLVRSAETIASPHARFLLVMIAGRFDPSAKVARIEEKIGPTPVAERCADRVFDHPRRV